MIQGTRKHKLLYLLKILFEETDDKQGLTMPQIIERLAEEGIDAERKAIYRDLAALEECGFEIEKLRTSPVQYSLFNRPFDEGELTLLVDAVQTSRFLTERRSKSLVDSVKSLGSKRQREKLSHDLSIEGRIKMQNESVFYNLDAIRQALAARRKITFKYSKYDARKKKVPKRDGRIYEATPVKLTYTNDCYYLVTFSDKYQDFVVYRVDRMLRINVSDKPATRNEQVANFDLSEYGTQAFGMFLGDPVSATLRFDEGMMDEIIDRFGTGIEVRQGDDGRLSIRVVVPDEGPFFGWLATWGDRVVIESPAELRAKYREHLRICLAEYE